MRKNTGTPATLRRAIQDGIERSEAVLMGLGEADELAADIEPHVLDFLRQKFGAAYLEAEDPPVGIAIENSVPIIEGGKPAGHLVTIQAFRSESEMLLHVLQKLAKAIGVVCLLAIASSSCGKEAVSCPTYPTGCGSSDHYGSQCLTFSEYRCAGWDVSDAVHRCGLAAIGGNTPGAQSCP